MNRSLQVSAFAAAVALAFGGPAAARHETAAATVAAGDDDRPLHFVTFTEPGLMHYHGGVGGLAATAPRPPQARRLDARSAAARAYRAYLSSEQQAHVAAIGHAIGRELQPTHRYTITRSGLAAPMDAVEAARVAALPGVVDVRPAGSQPLATFRGPAFISADAIWDGSATADGVGTRGQGIVIGVLDSGIYSAHPSFANDPACGFDAARPKLRAVDCTSSADGLCNGADPESAPESLGHGSHTASTAAGNTIDHTAAPAPALPDGVSMSGVAPCAAIRSYRVCTSTNCGDAYVLAGIENAIVDQVDVVNFSISGGLDPWSAMAFDSDAAFLDLFRNDVFIAAAAGNIGTAGENPKGKVNHLAPWVTTVAASWQDQILTPVMVVTGPGTPPPSLLSVALFPSVDGVAPGTPDLRDATLETYPPNPSGCSDGGGIPDGTFTGAIAVLRRGASSEGGTACTFPEKIANAVAAGAIAVVVANNRPGYFTMDTTGAPDVPAFSVLQSPGDALFAFLADHAGAVDADLLPSGIAEVIGDVIGSFSLRGPTNGAYQGETKPDIAAPGVLVYAASDAANGGYASMNGTSMASPHVAGAAALIRAERPDWTAMQIKSALMTTATNASGRLEDAVTPWTSDDVGSGRIDVARAVRAGLTLEETAERFVAANPSGGTVALRDLNLPALRDMQCPAGGCVWARTVVNQLATTGTWTASYAASQGDVAVTITPSSFALAPGASQRLVIAADPSASAPGSIAYGNVVLRESNGASPDQHLDVAVKGVAQPPPSPACRFGACNLQVDVDTGDYTLFGDGQPLFWLNRFTPLASDFPFYLTKVEILFLDHVDGIGAGARAGDTFDVYVYRDDDGDPSNGATFVTGVGGVEVTAPLGQMQTVALPGFGVQIDGGDVVIAVAYHGPDGVRPATGDIGPAGDRSWIATGADLAAWANAKARAGGSADDAIFVDGFDPPASPDLARMHLRRAEDAIPGWASNWVIRGVGVKGEERSLILGADVR